jgi:hypothetical protein
LPAHDNAYWLVSYQRHIIGRQSESEASVTLPVEILFSEIRFSFSAGAFFGLFLQTGAGLSKPLRSLILKHADSNLLEHISQWKVGFEPGNMRKNLP